MSAHLILPEAATDNHIVVFGMTGAGKSSVIRSAIVEPDLEAGRRVLTVTPKDDWWGIRLSKTGKSKGYDVPIFGGFHADYPLNVKDAALLAETYGTMQGSAIFCTARMSVTERTAWFTAFAETLLTKNKGRVRVVIDEAHVFMPKSGGRADVRRNEMLNAGNELVSSGRSQGLRIVLASQRSAKLHNDSSTQCKCLIAMQLMAPHDRQAVKDWIDDVADPEQGKAIIASLADLKPGEAWVWAPRAKMLERIQFPRPSTFDSSKPPDDDAGEGPTLPSINLDALQGKLAKVEAEKKASDPAALRTTIADRDKTIRTLESQLAAKATPAIDPAAIEESRKAGFEAAERELKDAAEKVAQVHIIAALERVKEALAPGLDKIIAELTAAQQKQSRPKIDIAYSAPPAPRQNFAPAKSSVALKPPVALKPRATNGSGAAGDASLGKGERIMLTAIAQYPEGATREQLTVLTGYKRSSRDTYIQRLGAGGLVDVAGNVVRVTQAGIDALGPDFAPLPTGEALQAYWLDRLTGGEHKILAHLIDVYPQAIGRDELDEPTGYKRSARDTYIQRLAARKLVAADRGQVKAADILFEAA